MDLELKFSYSNQTYRAFVGKVQKHSSTSNEVLAVSGNHLYNFSSEHLTEIYFLAFRFDNFPRNLMKFFPNLKAITMTFCGLRQISKHDFEGCDKLELLNLDNNYVQTLSADLFTNTPNIQMISLQSNCISFVHEWTFQYTKNLVYCNLKFNTKINVLMKRLPSYDSVTYENFINIIQSTFGMKLFYWPLVKATIFPEGEFHERIYLEANNITTSFGYDFTKEEYDDLVTIGGINFIRNLEMTCDHSGIVVVSAEDIGNDDEENNETDDDDTEIIGSDNEDNFNDTLYSVLDADLEDWDFFE
jgi:hypothetical protein